MREAAVIVAKRHALPADWLNDAAKGFIYTQPPQHLWAEYPGLRLYVPGADYVFAMKADAARPGDHEIWSGFVTSSDSRMSMRRCRSSNAMSPRAACESERNSLSSHCSNRDDVPQ